MRKLLMCRIIFCLLLSSPAMLFSQGNAFTFYSVNEGLAQSTVMDIYKDPKGLLWLGTGEGMSLWNGHTFRNVKYRYNDPQGLSNNIVRHFLPDPLRHCVWVGTESGLDCFNENGTKIINKIQLPEWAANDHIPLLANETHIWLFVTGKGIFKVDRETHSYTLVKNDLISYFWHIFPGTDLVCYQNQLKQLVKIHLLTGKTVVSKLPSNEPGFIFSDVIDYQDGWLWLSSHGLWKSDKKGENFLPVENFTSPVDSRKDHFTCICRDSSDRFWIFVEGKGLFTADAALSYLRPQHWDINGENILNRQKIVRKIICDAYNVLWIATDGEGFIRYNGNRMFFGSSLTEMPALDSAKWYVRAFFAEGNITWVGTFGSGLKKINYATGKIDSYNSPLFTAIHFIARHDTGSLFIGTDNGLYRFSNEHFIPVLVTVAHPSPIKFLNFIRPGNGRPVFATDQGMMTIDESSGKVILIGKSRSKYSGMMELPNGNIIAAAYYHGLNLLDKNLEQIQMLPFESMGLPIATTITDFVTDEKAGLWAASNIGILHLDAEFKITEVITDKNGLPSNMIYGITKLPSGELLISTGNGISIMDPSLMSFRNYNLNDGLRSNEGNSRAQLLAQDSFMYIGGVNGFVRKKFPFDAPSPVIFQCFTENFSVNDTIRDDSFSFSALSYFQNTISFNLRYSDFAFSESSAWTYLIDGLDSHLVTIPASVPFRFASLPPGEYTIHVFAPGYPDIEIFRKSFSILPPWWKTTWFKVLALVFGLVLVVSILYAITYFHYRKKLRKLEALRTVEKIRTRISDDIHDDLGAGLTKIALTSDLAAIELKADQHTSKKLEYVSGVARELSQSLKEVVWSVKPEHDNLESTIRYFKSYCGDFFDETGIAFVFNSYIGKVNIPVSPERRRNLFLILKESLNNIMKHSGAKNVTVETRIDDHVFEMCITDDGKGMPEVLTDAYNSNGMRNMNKRAQLLGMTFEIKKNDPTGTRITLRGPVN